MMTSENVQEVASKYPDRIKLILIRDIGNDTKSAEAQSLIEATQSKVPTLVFSNHEQTVEKCRELRLLP